MSKFKHPAIKQLTEQQVHYAPLDAKLEQVGRAEKFVESLDRRKIYSYSDICDQIIGFKSEMYPQLEFSGEDVLHDIRRFVEDVSGSADIDADTAGEPVLTVQDVSTRYNVSTKTVDRWRAQGLVSRRFKFGNRKRIGFLKSTVDRFVSRFDDKVRRGTAFSQLSVTEREEIIKRAHRMARTGGCPTEIAKRLAEKMHRSPETIRYTLRNYDLEHPDRAIFPGVHSPLAFEEKEEIYRKSQHGNTVAELAQFYCRKQTTIVKIINEVRAQRLLERKIDFMMSPEFELPNADELILADPPVSSQKSSKGKPQIPPELPPYLNSLYSIALLTKEEEVYYFRKMNYLKFKAHQLRESLSSAHPSREEMDRIEGFLKDALQVKNFLTRSNLRLVVSIAKKHIKADVNFFEMISDGNVSLIRAIEKFDYTKGFKFSTYASWAIMKNFARSIPAEHKHRDRYRTGKDEMFLQSHDSGSNPFQQELDQQKNRQAVKWILQKLDEREKNIIICRYGLEKGEEPQTLEQVGRQFGVTKERIRQLESRALQKLRKIAGSSHLDIPCM